MIFKITPKNIDTVKGLIHKNQNRSFSAIRYYPYTKVLNVIRKNLGLPRPKYGSTEVSRLSVWYDYLVRKPKGDIFIRIITTFDDRPQEIRIAYGDVVHFKPNELFISNMSPVDIGCRDIIHIKYLD